VVTSNKVPSAERPAPHRTGSISRGRRRLLCSMLTNYAHGLVALAVASTVFSAWQQHVWTTFGETAIAIAFLAIAFFIMPSEGD
jgi:hypothetical protein